MGTDIENDETTETAAQAAPTIAEVTVKGPGIAITRPVDEAVMSSIIALLFGAPLPGNPAPGGGAGPHRQAAHGQASNPAPSEQWGHDLTLSEFIDESTAKTFPQKIAAAGYFMTSIERKDTFSRDEVRAALVSAREIMPANFTRDWSVATSTNLIAEKPGEPGRFYIPKTGTRAVESFFQEVPKRRTSRRTTKKVNGSGGTE